MRQAGRAVQGRPKDKHQCINCGDKGITQYRIELIEHPIDAPPNGRTDNGADQKDHGQRNRHISKLSVHHGPHDSLCEYMEEIGSDCKNPFDPRTHQRRSDDKSASCADAAGNEIEQAALTDSRIEKFLEGKAVRKVIVVPKKLISIVVG